MTDQEINMAIAKANGKPYHKPTEEEINSGSYFQYEPDYFHNLNLMHDALNSLDDFQLKRVYVFLGMLPEFCETVNKNVVSRPWRMLRVSAHQLAEAFLRVKGLWKE